MTALLEVEATSKRFGGVISTPYGVLSYADFYSRKPDAVAPSPTPH